MRLNEIIIQAHWYLTVVKVRLLIFTHNEMSNCIENIFVLPLKSGHTYHNEG